MNAKGGDLEVLARLFATIADRQRADPESSYTAKLLAGGREGVARKFGEEALETVIAALAHDSRQTVRESADLLYHLMVLWAACGIAPEEVWRELQSREGTSGIAEKKSRGG